MLSKLHFGESTLTQRPSDLKFTQHFGLDGHLKVAADKLFLAHV